MHSLFYIMILIIFQPLLVVKREFPYHRWEPIYIGTNNEPLYSELLTWEGQQDKMTQVCIYIYKFKTDSKIFFFF